MHSIYYYCGDPKGKLNLILETGADAISLEESKKGFDIDILDVAKTVNGRNTLLGNLDAIHLLPSASEEELRDGLAYQIEAGWLNKGRFIMSVGSPITPGTTAEQVRLYINLTHELGRR
jgi:uroporphyrinogen-III decarboxylase